MEFNVGFASDIGRRRAQNQDHGKAAPELGLFSVSDGMGGHQGGETASATATDVILQEISQLNREAPWDPREAIRGAIEAANAAIFSKSLEEPKLRGMGTTTTALLFKDRTLTIGHVGDSRCYFLRPNQVWQLTRDHSLVQEKLRAGLITRKELRTDRMKNVITRSVGFEKEIEVELYHMEVKEGDTFLLCSDGLSGLIEDHELLAIVQKYLFEENNMEAAVQQLVAAANNHGGDDNITVLMAQVAQV